MSRSLRITFMLGLVSLMLLLMAPSATAQVLASDNFNRPNESPFGVSGDWRRLSTGGFVDLVGNEVAGVSGDAVYFWQGAGAFDGATSQFSRVRVTNPNGQVGVVVLGSSTQGLVAAWGGGTLFIYWYSGGVNVGALTTASSTLQAGDVIEILLDGGIIYAKINGGVVTSVANTTTLTSGRPGFETYQSGAKFDDWEGGLVTVVTGECDKAPDGTACDDGDPCTQLDVCKDGKCVGDFPVVCAPPDFCHGAGACDPVSGTCKYPEIDCNDNNECTADSCDPAKGCVFKPLANSCDDGNPCTEDRCDPAGGCIHTGTDGPDNSCSKVTDSSLCPLPTGLCGTSSSTPQFRLLEMQDPTYSTIKGTTILNDYIINASNPGQFFYNVFHAGAPGAAVDLTIEVPFPFVTQGANPIQVHGSAGVSGGCFRPSESLDGFTITTDGGNLSPSSHAIILRSDYTVPNLGNTTTIHVSGTVPDTGLVYVTIHLDYGLKKVTGWQQASNGTTAQGPDTNLDGILDGLGGGPIFIASPQPYGFGFNGGGGTHEFTPSSCNKFKKNPGVNGNTLAAATASPVQSVRVQLYGPTGALVATTISDADGFFMFAYRHKGKTATYTVKLPEFGKQKTVTLKANGYARADFEDLIPRN